MCDLIDFEAEVDTTDGKINENDSLIDDPFEPDNDLPFHYKSYNVNKNTDDVISEFLNEQNKSFEKKKHKHTRQKAIKMLETRVDEANNNRKTKRIISFDETVCNSIKSLAVKMRMLPLK